MDWTLVLGDGACERRIQGADALLRHYRQSGDTGLEYLLYVPITPQDEVVPEDLAVTLLVNSRAGYRAFQSLRDFGETVNLALLPRCPLEAASVSEVSAVASLIAQVASWPGFAASLATKVLHKKRPDLIPFLDNQGIFGAYLNTSWPAMRAAQDSVKGRQKIEGALRTIQFDLVRRENQRTWAQLRDIEPALSLIEVFDCVWWSYFRRIEPVGSAVGASQG